MRRRDVTGQQFGRLTAIKPIGKRGAKIVWECMCSCGERHESTLSALVSGGCRSCGCLLANRETRHGFAKRSGQTVEYHAYKAARQRCNNINRPDYKHYGGRGIKFLFTDFKEFFAEIGFRPTPKHSLDRIDNNGNYEHGNIRWATQFQQVHNSRPKSKRVA